MMRKPLAILTSLALVLPLPLAAQTSDTGTEQGEVAEIIVKINTPNGPKWYRLGKGVEAVDVTEGKSVQFNYLDDSIEAITVMPDSQDEETKSE